MFQTGDFKKTLDRAWDLHATNPRAAIAKVQAAHAEINSTDDVVAATRFYVHSFGVHLGEWSNGAKALRELRRSRGWRAHEQSEKAIKRSLRALELASTEDDGEVDLRKLTESDAAQAYALAAECLMERGADARAIEYLDIAVKRVNRAKLPDHDAAVRAISVAANNIATAFEEFPSLDTLQRDRIVLAAYIARMYWERAGTWLEAERAEYRLARCMVLAGYPMLAVRHAQHCLAICEENHAPALEFFFGVEALASALVANNDFEHVAQLQTKAQTLFAALADSDQAWCEPTLRKVLNLKQAHGA